MRIPAFIQPADDAVGSAPAEGLLSRLARLAAIRFRLWLSERRTLSEIGALDEATLRDIGVMRWQLVEHLRDERERVILRETGWRRD